MTVRVSFFGRWFLKRDRERAPYLVKVSASAEAMALEVSARALALLARFAARRLERRLAARAEETVSDNAAHDYGRKSPAERT